MIHCRNAESGSFQRAEIVRRPLSPCLRATRNAERQRIERERGQFSAALEICRAGITSLRWPPDMIFVVGLQLPWEALAWGNGLDLHAQIWLDAGVEA